MNRPLPIRSAFQAFRIIPDAARLLLKADRKFLWITIALTFIMGLGPVVAAYIAKLIIDYIIKNSQFSIYLFTLVGAEFLTWVVWTFSRHWSAVYQQKLRESTWLYLSNRVIKHAAELDISFYENPTNYDILTKALSDLEWRPTRFIFSLLSSFQNLITVLGFIATVIGFNPIIGIISLVAALPTFFAARDSGFIMFETYDMNTPGGRRAQYIDKLLTSEESAKELRLYNLSQIFIHKRNQYLFENIERRLKAVEAQAKNFSISESLAMVFQYLSVTYIVYMAVRRQITIGEFSLVVLAISRVRQQLSLSLADLGEVIENSLFFKNINELLKFPIRHNLETTSILNADSNVREIIFDNVSFSYPGSTKKIFHNLSLVLRPDEATAIVGVNGAGKTTLIKLLLRLYEPTDGSIKYNGVDIQSYDINAYQLLFSVILQDFMKYQFTVTDNIRISQFKDNFDMEDVEDAAMKAGIRDFITSLPNTWNTFLGRQFETEGQNLSGGQWQKIALARVLYRNAPILILDEPTAALDAEAEATLFATYKSITAGKMSILITHRFNTVKLADRIIVLEAGNIIEDGSHNDLMNRKGRYFAMYSSQAKSYIGVEV